MAMNAQIALPLEDRSAVSAARQLAAALARRLALDANASGTLAIAVTEAASNVVKHAGRGMLLLRELAAPGAKGVEIMTVDRGAGMANVAESMRDGHSTAGSAGTGLGALQRMAQAMDIYSQPGKGTVARFEIWPTRFAPPAARLQVGAVCVAKGSENECGDDWLLVQHADRSLLFLVDGLGHGTFAAEAARVAVDAFTRHASSPPAEILAAVHEAMRPTRGGAAAIAVLQPEEELCVYCGVGNIAAAVRAAGRGRNMISHNGTLGHRVAKVQPYEYAFPRGALLIAHTDGLGTRWDLDSYPGLESRHPAIVAAVLYRDHFRARDDTTVVALRFDPDGAR